MADVIDFTCTPVPGLPTDAVSMRVWYYDDPDAFPEGVPQPPEDMPSSPAESSWEDAVLLIYELFTDAGATGTTYGRGSVNASSPLQASYYARPDDVVRRANEP